MPKQQTIEKWGTFEAEFSGPSDGNPFLDLRSTRYSPSMAAKCACQAFTTATASIACVSCRTMRANGRSVRAPPPLHSTAKAASFHASAPSKDNHGPVSVRNRYHFAYADGTPFFSFGTTCYAWTHQPLDMQAQTLKTLKKTNFNKLRMGVFPKDYPYNVNEPLHPIFLARQGRQGGLRPPKPGSVPALRKSGGGAARPWYRG